MKRVNNTCVREGPYIANFGITYGVSTRRSADTFKRANITLINPRSFSAYAIKIDGYPPGGNISVIKEIRASDEKCIKELSL